MELDLQSLFELHVHSCTHWLRPRNPLIAMNHSFYFHAFGLLALLFRASLPRQAAWVQMLFLDLFSLWIPGALILPRLSLLLTGALEPLFNTSLASSITEFITGSLNWPLLHFHCFVFTWDPCGVPRLCTFCLFTVVIIDVAVFVIVIVVDG